MKFNAWKNNLLGSSEMKGPGGFEDATLVYSKRFIEAQDPDREPIPNVPNPHLITPFWLPNVLETYPFFHTFHRPRMSIICLLISKNEKPERFRIWRFRGYRKSSLRLNAVEKEGPKPEKVGGRYPQFAQNEGTRN